MKVFYYLKNVMSKRSITVLDITPADILNNDEITNFKLDLLISLIISELQYNRIDIYLDTYRMITLSFKAIENKKIYKKEIEVTAFSFPITSQPPSNITLKLISNGL